MTDATTYELERRTELEARALAEEFRGLARLHSELAAKLSREYLTAPTESAQCQAEYHVQSAIQLVEWADAPETPGTPLHEYHYGARR